MERIKVSAFLLGFLLAAGCGRNGAEAESGSPSAPLAVGEAKGTSPVLADVNQSLKAGAYDDAAARLLELQASGRNFSQREAADYRKALNEAYARAVEAADKGDTRAQAAIEMIRATGPR